MPGHCRIRRASSSNSCATSATDRRFRAAVASRSLRSDRRSRIVVNTRGSGRLSLTLVLLFALRPTLLLRPGGKPCSLMSILYYVVSELTSEYKAQNRLGGIGQNGSFRRIYGARGCATAVSRSADTYTSLLIAQAPIPSTSRRSSGSGSRTTLDRYGHLMPEMHQAAARKLDRLVFGSWRASHDARIRGGTLFGVRQRWRGPGT